MTATQPTATQPTAVATSPLGTASGPVLVGIDYSSDSMIAAELAAWEAQRHHLALRLVHVVQPPPGRNTGPLTAAMVQGATDLLDVAAQQLHQRHPDLPVEHTTLTGSPAATLINASTTASIVVIAARGVGGFPGLLTGSVSTQVTTHAHTPVIVTRREGTTPPTGPVVVGVDGSEHCLPAVAFAFDEARARHSPLIAVYAWELSSPTDLGPVTGGTYNLIQQQSQAQQVLAETLAGGAGQYPDVPVTQRAIRTISAAAILRDAAAGAGLLVVGSRGHGGFLGLLLGSVSHTVVNHVRCSVAIIHTP